MAQVRADLAVQIVRWVDDTQPGVVACVFVDASGRRHTVIDKVPIVSLEYLDSESEYPRPGAIRCTILSRVNKNRVRISTAEPDDEYSTDEETEFIVHSEQLSIQGQDD